MKKSEVIAAVNAINKIPVSKVADKAVRYTLIDNYLALRKVARDIEAEREDILDKFRTEWPAAVTGPQVQTGNISPELQAAKRHLDEDFERLGKAQVDVPGLKVIEKAAFLDALGDTEIAFEDIAALDGIVIK